MWRSIVGLLLLGCATSPASSGDGPFDRAKKGGEAAKIDFLDQELGKLVFDQERNPKGYVKAWYYMADAGQKEKAVAAMKEEYKKDGLEKLFDKEAPAIIKSLKTPGTSVFPFYRESAPLAKRKCQGFLLVGNLFGLKDEAELRSTLDDFLLTYLKSREEGLSFKEGDNTLELNPDIPTERDIAHSSLINLYARSVQIRKIAGKDRRASEDFRRAVVRNYLDSHKLYHHQLKRQQKIFDDNNENEMQKEIVSFLKFSRDMIYKDLKTAGVEHNVVDKDTFEYSLDGL